MLISKNTMDVTTMRPPCYISYIQMVMNGCGHSEKIPDKHFLIYNSCNRKDIGETGICPSGIYGSFESSSSESSNSTDTNSCPPLYQQRDEKRFHKEKKKAVTLSIAEDDFREKFYHAFTHKKRFPKRMVFIVHNHICSSLNIRRANRAEMRSVNLYFVNFAKYADQILKKIYYLSEEEKNRLFNSHKESF